VIETLANALRAPDIRRKILFTLGILIVVRALLNVPVPNVNLDALGRLFEEVPLLGLFNLFSGGGLSAASVTALRVNPYINASISARPNSSWRG
jgi:preprotein translocase subunit SecY